MDPLSLKNKILDLVGEYYRAVHEPVQKKEFKPGDRISYAGRVFDEKEMRNLAEASLDFWLTSGRFMREFETKLAEYLQLPYALFVNSGSSANLLAFMTLTSPLLGDRRIMRGDEVITVAAGFPTTVAPILQYGAVPVFVDVERSTANIDFTRLEAALSPKTKAVMIAHTLGNPFRVDAVCDFCKAHHLWLIEDNCDALGSRFAGKLTGTWGDIGTSSFYPPHHLTTGEGGAVYMRDPLLRKIALSIRDWGRDCECPSGVDNLCGHRFSHHWKNLPDGYDHKYVYSHFGFNLKATDLQASIGCAQIEKIESFASARRKNFEFLYNELKEISGLELFGKYPESDPSWFGFLMILSPDSGKNRSEFASYLESKGIQTRNLFAGNLLRQPCFDTLKEGTDYRVSGTLENTDLLMNNALWIGVYPGMTHEKLAFMAETIRNFMKGV